MDKTTHEVRTARWRDIVSRCQSRPAGQSIHSWLAENGIPEKSYYYWQRKIRYEAYDLAKSTALAGIAPAAPVSFAESTILAGIVEFSGYEMWKLEAVQRNVLSQYDITPKETALATQDNAWQWTLNIFLSRKLTDGKSERTIKLYRLQLSRMLSHFNKPCGEITEDDLFSYLVTYKQLRKVSNRYLEDIRHTMTSFFGWLYRKGFIEHDPSTGLDPIKFERAIKHPFTDEELDLLRSHCDTEREIALIDFLYSTGIRVSELMALNINDVNLNTLDVIVKGKGSKERQVYLTRTARLHLKQYLEKREDNNEALFVSDRSPHNRLSVAGVQNILHKVGERAGVDNTHPHRFRRTMATNVLKKGMALEEVSVLLGHVKLETTMIYCTVSQENVRHSHARFMCA